MKAAETQAVRRGPPSEQDVTRLEDTHPRVPAQGGRPKPGTAGKEIREHGGDVSARRRGGAARGDDRLASRKRGGYHEGGGNSGG